MKYDRSVDGYDRSIDGYDRSVLAITIYPDTGTTTLDDIIHMVLRETTA